MLIVVHTLRSSEPVMYLGIASRTHWESMWRTKQMGGEFALSLSTFFVGAMQKYYRSTTALFPEVQGVRKEDNAIGWPRGSCRLMKD
jgi:hypothetical protein